MPGALHRFHCGLTVQSQWKPNLDSGSSAKLPPMERSGTTTIALATPWLCSLSSAMNIRARDLPDAGGDLISRYRSPRRSKARSCMARMPISLALVEAPVRPVRSETEGMIGVVVMRPSLARMSASAHCPSVGADLDLFSLYHKLISGNGDPMPSSYTLGDHFEGFVKKQLASGRYNSASEVMRDALRLMEERERRLSSLDAAIARGLADVDARRLTDADEVFDRLHAKYAAMGVERGMT